MMENNNHANNADKVLDPTPEDNNNVQQAIDINPEDNNNVQQVIDTERDLNRDGNNIRSLNFKKQRATSPRQSPQLPELYKSIIKNKLYNFVIRNITNQGDHFVILQKSSVEYQPFRDNIRDEFKWRKEIKEQIGEKNAKSRNNIYIIYQLNQNRQLIAFYIGESEDEILTRIGTHADQLDRCINYQMRNDHERWKILIDDNKNNIAINLSIYNWRQFRALPFFFPDIKLNLHCAERVLLAYFGTYFRDTIMNVKDVGQYFPSLFFRTETDIVGDKLESLWKRWIEWYFWDNTTKSKYEHVPLFDTTNTNGELIVNIKDNFLQRHELMENRIIIAISDAKRSYKKYTANDFLEIEGLIYMIYTLQNSNEIKPIYIGKIETLGENEITIEGEKKKERSATLNISDNTKNSFARWGNRKEEHIGGLSMAFPCNEEEDTSNEEEDTSNEKEEKYRDKWLPKMFIPTNGTYNNINRAVLREQVYFQMKAWEPGKISFNGIKNLSTVGLEGLLIAFANHLYPDSLVNEESSDISESTS